MIQSPHAADMLPAVIDATHDRCELPALIAEERARLRHELTHRGALLFRGFLDAKTSAIGSFERAIKELSGKPLTYSERSSPRTSIKGNIYTSTDYPPDEEIFLHNENSYQSSWPRLLYFYCAQEPETLGATPLADVRQVHDSIDPSVLAEFRARGWMVVRNFHQRFGVSWRQLFNTEERAEVERQCRERDIRFEWRDNDGLRTTAIRQAVHRHPDTDEPVWFNHATFFHSSTLAAEVREGLLGLFGAQDLPTNTYYGDGGEIPDDVAAHLRACYLGAKRRFNWRRGDLLVIDNMLVAHGREPFTGPRKIAVAMAEAYMPGRGRDEAEPAGVAPAHAVASTSSLRGSVR